MCGLAGAWHFESLPQAYSLTDIGRKMGSMLTHRGPDEDGIYVNESVGIVLAHTRLSIIDLTEEGRQPMRSSCGRFVLIYNGELYDTDVLREELQRCGRKFRGRSDTEVLVEGCAEFGVENFVRRLNGIFAFALFDLSTNSLHLVRDRLGVKPLYFGHVSGALIFGSELKALRVHPTWSGELSARSVASFLQYSCVPSSGSIFSGIRQVRPGSIVTSTIDQRESEAQYWSLDEVISGTQSRLNYADAKQALAHALRQSVRRQMVSDVPIAGLLSGGYDSSLVVALMQELSGCQPVQTFSLGFEDSSFDEAPYAKAVARHLRTDHHELYISSQDAIDVIPQLASVFDEPFADSSQIPTLLLSRFVGQNVKVALSGDGGDELFAGYGRYQTASFVTRLIDQIPRFFQRTMASYSDTKAFSSLAALIGRMPGVSSSTGVEYRLLEMIRELKHPKPDIYRFILGHWPKPSAVMLLEAEPFELRFPDHLTEADLGPLDRFRYLDTHCYLPDDILTKVDRTSMANSLEIRVPLLDSEVVEVAWSLPRDAFGQGKSKKRIVGDILEEFIPRRLFERPKMGFGIPIDQWLRGPLSSWAEDLINPSSIKKDGIFRSDEIWRIWKQHKSSERDWGYWLWDILMFQAWRQEYKSQSFRQ
ncbi:asparagine synthase (glutamine-hydrolyzing) [Gammaproteobacteria bacterium]|nr:asparagine synthase (glutamine-hydrolyzing) [Gammaproteobacteria bacterium]